MAASCVGSVVCEVGWVCVFLYSMKVKAKEWWGAGKGQKSLWPASIKRSGDAEV